MPGTGASKAYLRTISLGLRSRFRWRRLRRDVLYHYLTCTARNLIKYPETYAVPSVVLFCPYRTDSTDVRYGPLFGTGTDLSCRPFCRAYFAL